MLTPKRRRRELRAALLMVAPFLFIFVAFFLYPTYSVIALSFTDAPLIGDGNWVGLANYKKLLNDRLFYTSLWNNLYFVLLTVIQTVPAGKAAAVSSNQQRVAAAVVGQSAQTLHAVTTAALSGAALTSSALASLQTASTRAKRSSRRAATTRRNAASAAPRRAAPSPSSCRASRRPSEKPTASTG